VSTGGIGSREDLVNNAALVAEVESGSVIVRESERSRRGSLVIGVSAGWMHADPTRTLFDGRSLLFLEHSMAEWLMGAPGLLPVMIPWPRPDQDVAGDAEAYASAMDGLVLQGGADVAPESYGERPLRPEWSGDPKRDACEIALIRAFLKRRKPILGICRGHQILNVALGGSLFQDVETQVEGSLRHRDPEIYHHNAHAVELVEGSHLQQMYGVCRATINSVHHQAVKRLAPQMKVEAVSPVDGVIEAMRYQGDSFALGVQWHPEFQEVDQGELLSTAPLLSMFTEAVHRRMARPGGEQS
jgi:putative glutamine amidotransferase